MNFNASTCAVLLSLLSFFNLISCIVIARHDESFYHFTNFVFGNDKKTLFVGSSENMVFRFNTSLGLHENVFVADSNSYKRSCFSNLSCTNDSTNCLSIRTKNSNYLTPVFSTPYHILVCGHAFEGACVLANYELKKERFLCRLLFPESGNFLAAKKQSGERVWVVASDIGSNTLMTFNQINDFSVMDGFPADLSVSSNIYHYFLSFQRKNFVYHVVSHMVGKNSSSKGVFIIRTCLDNLNKSLVEVPITVSVKEVDYVEIIDAQYSDNFLFLLTQQSNSNVLFVISMNDVEFLISQVISDCFSKGYGYKSPYYLEHLSPKCSVVIQEFDGDYCGQYPFHHQIFSQNQVSTNVSHKFECSQVSRIVFDFATNILLASCGNGTILKFKLDRDPKATLTLTGSIDDIKELSSSNNQPLILDMKLGQENDLFVLTNQKILRLSLHNCSSYSSCHHCASDPYCGWCVPRKRCTQREDCTEKKPLANIEFLWLKKCIEIISVTPNRSPIKSLKNRRFQLEVTFIPDPNSTNCQASSSETLVPQRVDSNVTIGDDGYFHVECLPFNDIPSEMINRGVTTSTLFISIVYQGHTLNETIVPLIMCSNYKSCETCFVSSDDLCLWCPKTHKCVDSSLVDTCLRDSVYKLDHATCPQVKTEMSTILVPVDHSINLTLKVYYLTTYQIERGIFCRIGSKIHFPAIVNRINSTDDVWDVLCSIEMRRGQILESNEVFNLHLVWGKDKNVIKSSKILKAEVYDCMELGRNCGQCLVLDARFDCVLCEDRFCTHSSSCSGPFKKGTTNMCTNPIISSFYPQGAPLQSKGTLVTVHGSNLPFTLQDINITVAKLPCSIDPDLSHHFVMGEKIVCRLIPSDIETRGQVLLSSIYSAKSSHDFIFKDPEVTGMHPLRGPRSGKTLVTIAGHNLHFGSKVVVEVNKITGEVVSRNETTIFFLTPPCQTPSIGVIGFTVKIDEVPLKYSMGVMQFTYMDDPVVTIIDPNLALKSGGNIVGIRGANLKNVQQPKFIVYTETENRTSDCRRDGSSTYMECPTPDLTGLKVKLPKRLECGLIMDGVVGLLRLGWNHSKTILYSPDPTVEPLELPIVYKKADNKLVLYGQDLQVLQSFTDLVIGINNASCDKAFINSSNIICDLPDLTRTPLDDGKATIMVSLGNFKKVVGEVEYGTKKISILIAIICAIIGLIILLVIALIMLIKIYKRRHANASFQNNFLLKHPTSSSSPLRNVIDDSGKTSPSIKAMPLIKDDVAYFEEALQRIESAKIKNVARNVFVTRNKIQLENLIGRGGFTRVHSAQMLMRNQHGYEADAQVCVKVIEDANMSERTLDSFIRETAIMNNFKHDNVLNILAVCLGHHKEPWVVLPLMSNGDLRSYIKDKAKTFTARQLLQMAQQVAGGMSYLSSLDFVHRELCARNCLLDENLKVKVSDFGLTTELQEKEFFSSSPLKFDRLPIKWMAIESIENFIFTSKSDVWSFGVLVWELMTRGVVPYPDVQPQQIRFLITSGRRLKKPKYCPPVVYNMMMDCWQEIPERRPTFTDLVNRLELLLNPPRKKDSQSEHLDETEPLYINTTDPQSPGYTRVKQL